MLHTVNHPLNLCDFPSPTTCDLQIMALPSDLPLKIQLFKISCSAALSAWHELPVWRYCLCVDTVKYSPVDTMVSQCWLKAGTVSYEVGQHWHNLGQYTVCRWLCTGSFKSPYQIVISFLRYDFLKLAVHSLCHVCRCLPTLHWQDTTFNVSTNKKKKSKKKNVPGDSRLRSVFFGWP